MKSHKTTDEEFQIFVDECKRLIDKLNLDDWTFYYQHKKLDGANAQAITNIVSRSATLKLSTNYDCGTNDVIQDIKESARHEVCHIFLADISDLIGSRWVTQDEYQQASERITRKLENVIKDF